MSNSSNSSVVQNTDGTGPANVVVIGLGYVGLPLAVLAASRGYTVTGIDVNQERVEQINAGELRSTDTELRDAIAKKPITARTNFDAISEADIVIVAVPTPVENNMPDLSFVESATNEAARRMKKNSILLVESTINPGVCDELVIPLVEKITGRTDGEDIFVAHCPERISPGDDWKLEDINRVVGANSKKGLELAKQFYDSILDAEVRAMNSIKEAEAVKIVENSFRDVNIAFVNELAMSFHKLGIDIENVIDGAATKPYAFMAHRPGAGVGGHCIPVDPYYLIEYASGYGFEHDFLRLARKINSGMPRFTVELLQDALNEQGIALKGASIGLLGLSYKPDIDDDRESPAHEIKEAATEHGAKVESYDAFSTHNSDVDSLEAVIAGKDGLVIATAHSEFRAITPEMLSKAGVKVLVDGRNMLKGKKDEFKDAGIAYVGIGQR